MSAASRRRAWGGLTLLIAAYYNSRDYDAAYRAIKAMPSAMPTSARRCRRSPISAGWRQAASGDLESRTALPRGIRGGERQPEIYRPDLLLAG